MQLRVREEADARVVQADMVGEVAVLPLSYAVSLLGFLVLRVSRGEAGVGLRQRGEGLAVCEVGVGEQHGRGGGDEVGTGSPGGGDRGGGGGAVTGGFERGQEGGNTAAGGAYL